MIFTIVFGVVVGYYEQGANYFGVIFSITTGVMAGRLLVSRHIWKHVEREMEEIKE